MASPSELRALLRNVGPVVLRALARGQVFRPACELAPPDPDILCEFDVAIPMSEGFHLTANIFRSRAAGEAGVAVPVIMCAHPYDNRLIAHTGGTPLGGPPQQYRILPQQGRPRFSTLTSWESPDPNFWVPAGYAVVNLNLPGYGSSQGPPSIFSAHQGKCYYEAIEWVAAQSWSTGRVGLNGVSFLAISQYHVAACRAYGGPPPALACISPWEGVGDPYRDLLFPGGAKEEGFPLFWWLTEVTQAISGTIEDFLESEGCTPPQIGEVHPTFDDYAAAKVPDLEAITVPTLLCASFSDHGIHTPGGFKAFMRIGSENKWLYTHRGLKWDAFYSREVQELTREFFDCFVKEETDNGFHARESVRLEVRASRDEVVAVRAYRCWPPEETRYERLFVDVTSSRLVQESPAKPAEATWDARRGSVSFRHQFTADTIVAGHMSARLWVEARETSETPNDMVLCAAVRKLDAGGRHVPFYGAAGNKNDAVTRGFLRVAMRETDPDRSREWLPEYALRREQPLSPGDVVQVELELYPSATLFREGECLEFVLAGREIVPSPPFRKDVTPNVGRHVLHGGGERPSSLLLPILS